MKEMTTTTTALAIIDHKGKRTAAAHARHHIDTRGTWTAAPDGIRPPVHLLQGEQINTTANTAAYIAIRARHASAGDLPILKQLQDSAASDTIWNTLPDITAQALESRAKHADYTSKAAALERLASRKNVDYDTRAAAQQQIKHIKALAEQERRTYQSIESRAEQLTASDRADIVQAATIAIIQAINRGTYTDKDFANVCHAAGQAIKYTASPDAFTSSRTRRTEITPEQAKQLAARAEARTAADGHIREYITRTGSKGYTTLDYKDGKIYRVDHETTVAPYVSYDQWISGDAVQGLSTNGGINAITGQTDGEQINSFLTRANLTEREQAIVRAAADNTAAKAGQAAKNKYLAENTPAGVKRITASKWERIIKAADNVGQAARWNNAFARCGITSDTNRTTIKARIKSKLYKALTTPEPITAADRAEKTVKQWECMQRNSHRGTAPDRTKRPDIIAVVTKAAAKQHTGKNAVMWVDHDTVQLKAHAPADTSAKPMGFDARWIIAAITRYKTATNTLALPAAGDSTASTRQQHRRAAADHRHPNISPDVIITPENPKAAEQRRRAAQWARYWDKVAAAEIK